MFDTDVNINNKALGLQRTAISKSNLLLYRSHNTIFPKVHVKTWLRKNNSQIPLHFKGFSASDRDFFKRWKNKVLNALFFHFVQPERKWTANFFSCLKTRNKVLVDMNVAGKPPQSYNVVWNKSLGFYIL